MQITPSATTIRQPWLNLARITWMLLSTMATIAFVTGFVLSLREPLPTCVAAEVVCGPWHFSQEDIALAQQQGLPVQLMMVIYFVSSLLPKLCFVMVALFIFWRRSDDWVALLLSLMMIGFVIEGVQNLGPFMPLVNGLYALITGIFMLLPFIFPSGRIVPGWLCWFIPPLILGGVATTLLPQLGVPMTEQFFALTTMVTFSLWFLLGGYAAIYRYRYVSNTIERQQTKWVIGGILGTFTLFIPFTIIALAYPPSQPSSARLSFFFFVFLPIYLFSYFLLPGSIAFAILRYRLYDIDVIIRRTLQYSLVTGLLALVYFGGVVVLQGIFRTASGETSALAVVLSTLMIAGLFAPLRGRIQTIIDRRFYRQKYDAAQVLAQFAQTARDEVEMEQLAAAIIHTIAETIQPETVSIWLKPVVQNKQRWEKEQI